MGKKNGGKKNSFFSLGQVAGLKSGGAGGKEFHSLEKESLAEMVLEATVIWLVPSESCVIALCACLCPSRVGGNVFALAGKNCKQEHGDKEGGRGTHGVKIIGML